jgi:hypothetical protein
MTPTNCPGCGSCYQERTPEAAGRPDRLCPACWQAQARRYQARVPATPRRTAGTCRSCGAEIVWLRTASGRNMPINAETFEPGDEQFDAKRHQSHFATCPEADQHRRVAR